MSTSSPVHEPVAVFRHSPYTMRATFPDGFAAQWEQEGDELVGYRAVIEHNVRVVAQVELHADGFKLLRVRRGTAGSIVIPPQTPVRLDASDFLAALGEAAHLLHGV